MKIDVGTGEGTRKEMRCVRVESVGVNCLGVRGALNSLRRLTRSAEFSPITKIEDVDF